MSQYLENRYDVLIVGAGPAGCTAALALKAGGLKVALLDKSSFPRDKVCGDAIPARAVKTLRQISPDIAEHFDQYDKKLRTKHSDVVYGKRTLKIHWQIPAYTCARMDFDNYMFSLVKKHTDTVIYEHTYIRSIEQSSCGYVVEDKNGNSFIAKLLIGADGAQSITAKKLASYILDREHHIGSVRAYYKGIEGLVEDKTEVFLDKKFQPGYFWIFPLPNGMANVGFGMMSADIANRKINLKEAFCDFIEGVPALKNRFAHAELVGKLDGHSLPIASKRVRMSGSHFMLCGDAASLIDPITGEGIGNAMVSGYCAAMQAVKCFEQNDFSEGYIKQYEDEVWKVIGEEIRVHTQGQKILRKYPRLLDLAFFLSGWEPIRKMMQDKF